MNIVVISSCSPREKLVVHHLIRNFPNVTVVHPASKGPAPAAKKTNESLLNFWGKKILNFSKKKTIEKITRSVTLDPNTYRKFEFDHRKLNTDEGIEFLRSLKPSILITCNAPILREKALQVPRLAAMNVHYGIPPQYRGNNTLFWPWYFKDFDNIGGSIHYLNSGVDTGSLLAKAYPALETTDGETELDLKTSQILGVALTEIIRFILEEKGLPVGMAQSEKGRNFKLADRTVAISLKAILLQKLGRLKPTPRPERIEYFLSNVQELNAEYELV